MSLRIIWQALAILTVVIAPIPATAGDSEFDCTTTPDAQIRCTPRQAAPNLKDLIESMSGSIAVLRAEIQAQEAEIAYLQSQIDSINDRLGSRK